MTCTTESRVRKSLLAALALCLGAGWPAAASAEGRAVVAPETPVRSAPFDVAPELARLHAGDKVPADDQPQGAWRRVALPDGRWGFVREADTEHSDTAPPPPAGSAAPSAAAPVSPLPAPGVAMKATGSAPPPASPATAQVVQLEAAAQSPPEPDAGPLMLGVMFELLPVGTVANAAVSQDTLFAVGVAPFFDGALSPYFALGLSPQMIFRVRGDHDTTESAKELDLRARLTGRVPMSPRARVFGRVSPAYSVLLLPSPVASPGVNADRPTPQGFLLDVTVGVEIAVLPKLFVISDVGYQAGFQSTNDGDLHTSYLHLGAGFAIGL